MAALLAGIAALAALNGAEGQAQSSPALRPNVVMIMTDDQTLESMRVMPNVKTLLADQGVTFDNNFVSYSLCCPSRATYLTGQYAHNHGVWGNAAPNGGYYKLDSTNTLPVWLNRAGYQTIHVGKYLNGYGTRNAREVPPGWGLWYGSVDPTTYRYYNYTLNENGTTVNYGTGVANYQTDVYARKAVSLIAAQAADPRPFFLSVAFLAPHAGGPRDPDDPSGQGTPSPAPRHRNLFRTQPLPTPPSFNEADVSDKPAAIRNRALLTTARINKIRENYQQRLESLLAVDEAVAQIVNQLAAIGKLDQTYIIFTSDNGFMHGEHRVPQGKIVLYEPSIRVPLIIRGPNLPAGVHRSQFVENIDLAPTIVDATDAQPGRVMDGKSLIPFAKDPLLHSGRDLLLETPTYAAIRTPNWLYAEHVTGEKEFYNLARDRDELNSLQNDVGLTAMRTNLAARLARLRGCSGATCRRGPQIGLRSSVQNRRLGCRRSRVFLRVGGPSSGRIVQTAFYIDGHLLKRDRRRPFTVTVPKRFAKPDGSLLEALVTLTDSRRMTLNKHIRGCSL
jgi:N-acetylglucosamine-6-sulfatase